MSARGGLRATQPLHRTADAAGEGHSRCAVEASGRTNTVQPEIAKEAAAKLALTALRLRFKSDPQLRQEVHSLYIKELFASFERLTVELTPSLLGTYEIKMGETSIDIVEGNGRASTPIVLIPIDLQVTCQITFHYKKANEREPDPEKYRDQFHLDVAGPDQYLWFTVGEQQGFTNEAVANHVLARGLRGADSSLQSQTTKPWWLRPSGFVW